MKIEFELIQEDEGTSFRILHERIPAEAYAWQYHYHPEFELVCVLAGNGTRQVGNHAGSYENGDLVLMGPDLPHSGFGLNTNGMIEQVVIQFKKEVFAASLLLRPEMKGIELLLERSKYGVCFGVATKERVMKKMVKLLKLAPFERFMEITQILQILAASTEYTLLNAQVTLPNTVRKVHVRLQNIFNYVEQNFQEEINIRKVAAIAHLTVPAFCNYFKKIMNITFTDFINQYRIEQACILLQQEKSIGEVCFECGFNNVPYFNKVFKNIVKKTPSAFKKLPIVTNPVHWAPEAAKKMRTLPAMYSTAIPVATLPVMESFYTLQGEGNYQGRAAYFIRLGGCDVGCVWCDVKDSWDASRHPQVGIDTIVQEASRYPGRLAVVTGGEPLLQPLDALTEALHAAGFHTNIETSGSSPLSGQWDWICLSPKKFKAPLPAILPMANELKIIVFNTSDFSWAEQYAALVSPQCKLYLQPEWDKAAIVTPLIVDYIKANPRWQLSLQVHKYINVP